MPKGVKKLTKEWRRKMSETHKRIGSPWLVGHKTSSETRKKIGDANRGHVHTKEFRELRRLKMTGKKHSEDTRIKMSESRRGSRNGSWKGGITKESYLLRTSKEYKLWRESVLKRDERQCVWCDSKTDLQADHIKSFRDFPELRFAIDNGRTLCRSCHIKTYSK